MLQPRTPAKVASQHVCPAGHAPSGTATLQPGVTHAPATHTCGLGHAPPGYCALQLGTWHTPPTQISPGVAHGPFWNCRLHSYGTQVVPTHTSPLWQKPWSAKSAQSCKAHVPTTQARVAASAASQHICPVGHAPFNTVALHAGVMHPPPTHTCGDGHAPAGYCALQVGTWQLPATHTSPGVTHGPFGNTAPQAYGKQLVPTHTSPGGQKPRSAKSAQARNTHEPSVQPRLAASVASQQVWLGGHAPLVTLGLHAGVMQVPATHTAGLAQAPPG
jgi:hypothetical protein